MSTWIMYSPKFEASEINPELAVSPWSGHRNFAYDLIANTIPSRVVELGTHYGCSFFSFLQACKDFNLSSEIIAIDCWEGDEQAGFYGEEVWRVVNKTISEKFPKQNSRLIRKYFSYAISDVEDDSVDIIHIDGLHTYEAVKEDFVNWLPKLKANGIMLFHDVNSELKYGSNDFWNEVIQTYPAHYMFEHSWGLGVLFPKGDEKFQYFEKCNLKDKIEVYTSRAISDIMRIQLDDHKRMVEERDKSILSMTEMIDERDKSITTMTEMINERDKSILSMTEMIDERDKSISSMAEMINERDKSILSMTEMIDERDKSITTMTEMINERDKSILSMTEMIDERDKSILSMTETINEQNTIISTMRKIDGKD